jgi:predicted nucleotidyltransferase
MRNEKINQIMNEAVKISQNAFGDSLCQVWLFGSHARGDAHGESDVDFMVVLNEPIDSWQAIDTVYCDFSMEMLNLHDELPSVLITDIKRFNGEKDLIYATVKREGILYYAG